MTESEKLVKQLQAKIDKAKKNPPKPTPVKRLNLDGVIFGLGKWKSTDRK